MRRPITPTLAAAAVLAALLVGGASGSDTQSTRKIPNARGVFSGCYDHAGALRVVPGKVGCRPKETRVTWNQRGQRGAPGAQGATGAVGPQGLQGGQGPRGADGARGQQGPSGPAGPAGPQGAAGADGAVGPQGPQGDPGLQGAQGRQGDPGAPGPAGAAGPAGPAGPAGATGAAGPSGSQLVTGTPVTSAPNAGRNTTLTATATCPAGKVALGGGGLVTTTATQKERVYLQASYPSSASVWTAVGVVGVGALGSGQTMTVSAYVLCSL